MPILAIDQGTTSSRAIIYDHNATPIASAQKEFTQHFPKAGWVEHDATEIWESVSGTIQQALQAANLGASDITAIGITNQRETAIIWDRQTGRPLHNAIVWQDRRTAGYIEELREAGHEQLINKKTGLLLDPYFTASKFAWFLENIPGLRQKAEQGNVLAGTVDSWLVYNLSAGKSHITDISNACRTMLMNLQTGQWDSELLQLFDIPRIILPEIVPNSGMLACTALKVLGTEIPITGMAGDQQAALFGQLCLNPGDVKCTYGTGCFMLMNVGEHPVPSQNRLLSSVAWKIGNQPTTYALEGSVFSGGAAIQWLRDGLKIIHSAPEVDTLAGQVADSDGVIFVPAFTGLGAPHWDATARGALLGITRGTSPAHIAYATLEGIAFQITELIGAMQGDSARHLHRLRVDGGACASNLLMQMQADLLGIEVERPKRIETTAQGAAFMAGLGAGIWSNATQLDQHREIDRIFTPESNSTNRRNRLKQWRKAVKRVMHWS